MIIVEFPIEVYRPNNYLSNFVNSKKLTFLIFIFSLFLAWTYFCKQKFWDHHFVPSLLQVLRCFLTKKVWKKFDKFHIIWNIFFNFMRNFGVKKISFFSSFSSLLVIFSDMSVIYAYNCIWTLIWHHRPKIIDRSEISTTPSRL